MDIKSELTIEKLMEIVEIYGSLDVYRRCIRNEFAVPKRTAFERRERQAIRRGASLEFAKTEASLIEQSNKLKAIGECIVLGLIKNEQELGEVMASYSVVSHETDATSKTM